jgi:hypothetical protein
MTTIDTAADEAGRRDALADGGVVVVADEKVVETFTAPWTRSSGSTTASASGASTS